MQREREESVNSGKVSDSFGDYESVGAQKNTGFDIFNGRSPLDELLFPRAFGSIFGSSSIVFGSEDTLSDLPLVGAMKEPIIQELDSDDEDVQIVGETCRKGDKDKANINKNPHVEHPDDETGERKNKGVVSTTNYDKAERTRPPVRSASFQKVTYGGIDGAYYTSTTTRRTGSDGVVLEESKQADRTTGQATHRISRGIHDKGHSVLRRLKSDGNVDTTQTLHNLEEDELAGFEQAWKGNADRHLPGWERFNFHDTAGSSGFSWGGNHLALPFEGFLGRRTERRSGASEGSTTLSSSGGGSGRAKKVVRINIE